MKTTVAIVITISFIVLLLLLHHLHLHSKHQLMLQRNEHSSEEQQQTHPQQCDYPSFPHHCTDRTKEMEQLMNDYSELKQKRLHKTLQEYCILDCLQPRLMAAHCLDRRAQVMAEVSFECGVHDEQFCPILLNSAEGIEHITNLFSCWKNKTQLTGVCDQHCVFKLKMAARYHGCCLTSFLNLTGHDMSENKSSFLRDCGLSYLERCHVNVGDEKMNAMFSTSRSVSLPLS